MSKTYVSLELGGRQRGLKFALGTLHHMRDIIGGDPLDNANYGDTYQFVHAIVYGGLMCNCDVKDEAPDFSKDNVARWISGWDIAQTQQIIKQFNDAFTLSGEGGQDTRGQAPSVE